MLYKITKNKRVKSDIVIMLLIMISPFLFFAYNIVPDDQKWEILWFTIDAGLYENADYYVWLFFIRFLTIMILCLWFLTCTYNWKYILFIPLFLEINKIFLMLRQTKIDYSDEKFYLSIYFQFSVSILSFILLLWMNKKLAYGNSVKSINMLLNDEINGEYQKLSKFSTSIYTTVKSDFKKLNKRKVILSKKEYLTQLILLRDRLNNM